jgi:hypothetical protein
VTKPLLPHLQRHAETVHKRLVGVAKCVKPAAPDLQRLKNRLKLPFHEKVWIPRCSVASHENQLVAVWFPAREKIPGMQCQLGGNCQGRYGVLRFWQLQFPPPRALLDAKDGSIKVIYAKSTQLAGPQTGLGCEPIERAVRLRGGAEDFLNLLEGKEEPLTAPGLGGLKLSSRTRLQISRFSAPLTVKRISAKQPRTTRSPRKHCRSRLANHEAVTAGYSRSPAGGSGRASKLRTRWEVQAWRSGLLFRACPALRSSTVQARRLAL